MAKFEKAHRLPLHEHQQLMLEFCHALVVVKNLEEAASILVDLFSKQEMEMIAKRLKIAKLLVKGHTYEKITSVLKVSPATISRVQGWLDQSGAGYRLVIQRDKDMTIPAWQEKSNGLWSSVKRKYPMHFWPQLLLEEVVRSANNRQRQKLFNTLKVLKQAGEKHRLFRQIEQALKQG